MVEVKSNCSFNNLRHLVFFLTFYFLYQANNPRDINAYTDCSTVDLPIEQFRGLSYELRDLHPDTPYRVEIMAENRIGRSDPNIALFRTAKGKFTITTNTKFVLNNLVAWSLKMNYRNVCFSYLGAVSEGLKHLT